MNVYELVVQRLFPGLEVPTDSEIASLLQMKLDPRFNQWTPKKWNASIEWRYGPDDPEFASRLLEEYFPLLLKHDKYLAAIDTVRHTMESVNGTIIIQLALNGVAI